jgi:hypothetical protein
MSSAFVVVSYRLLYFFEAFIREDCIRDIWSTCGALKFFWSDGKKRGPLLPFEYSYMQFKEYVWTFSA